MTSKNLLTGKIEENDLGDWIINYTGPTQEEISNILWDSTVEEETDARLSTEQESNT